MPADGIPDVKQELSPATSTGTGESQKAFRRRVEEWTVQKREHLEQKEQWENESRSMQVSFFLEVIGALDRLGQWLDSEEAARAREDPSQAKWIARLDIIAKQLTKTLAKKQVAPLDLIGEAPPGAVTVEDRVEIPGVEQETIHEIIERGWLWKAEVLRKATVIVAVPPAGSAKAAGDGGEETIIIQEDV